MSLLLRPAIDRDLTDVGALHYHSRGAAYAGLVSAEALAAGSPEVMGQWWTERWRYERDTHRLTVADQDGRLIGFTYAGPSTCAAAVELYAIHVDPGAQGSGVGRRLMAMVVDDLRAIADATTERAVLWVLTGNTRARRFYERAGWTADGSTREAPIGPELVPQTRYSRSLEDCGAAGRGGST